MEHPSENMAFVSRNILDNRRTVTNTKMLIFFMICLLIWIPIVIYAFSAGDSKYLSPTNTDDDLKINASKISTTIGYVLLCGFFSVLFYIILRWVPNISYVTFIAIWVQLIGAILVANEYVNFSRIQTLIGSALGVIVMHVIISAEWFHLPESLIKESCKVMKSVPSTILFAAVSYFLSLLIAAITFTSFLYMVPLSGAMPILLMYADLLIGVWLCCVSLGIGSMTLFATYSMWYWADNKNEVSFGTVLRSLKIIIRYHIGTLAFGTSVFGVLRTVWALIVHAISYAQEHGVSLNYATYVVYNIFDTVVFRFTMIGGLAKCATSGSGYSESIESAVNYCETRPKRCLLAVKVMEYVLVFVLTVMSVLMIASLYSVIINNDDYKYNKDKYFLISIFLGSFLFIWAVLTTFVLAYYSILVCFFEDLEVNDDSERRPYSMSQKLRLALNHEGPPPCIRGCMPHIIDREE